jgi:16S rRNA (uracil1498-N3)-methyltransferase
MECIYLPELNEDSEIIQVENEEFKHLKALRLKEGDYIAVSNGAGLIAETKLINITKDKAKLQIVNRSLNFGELNCKLALALSILSDRTRFEFALEKAVEIGITDFYPMITDYCEKKTISIERLNSKAVAAMKQTKRSILPKVHQAIKLKELSSVAENYENIILTDWDGKHPDDIKISGNTLILVGPEGGFSVQELEFLKSKIITDSIILGKRRLRAETAGVAALSIISMKLMK